MVDNGGMIRNDYDNSHPIQRPAISFSKLKNCFFFSLYNMSRTEVPATLQKNATSVASSALQLVGIANRHGILVVTSGSLWCLQRKFPPILDQGRGPLFMLIQ